MVIRPLDARSSTERELVARRMRLTLEEVLGIERGRAMYTLEWLRERVDLHLEQGAVFLAQDELGRIAGHTILRVEPEEGLFSTTYVDPAFRRRSVARQLVRRGEDWLRGQGARLAATYTDESNYGLQQLFLGLGYGLQPRPDAFVRLFKCLESGSGL
ncbi:GNAT family N-acetyltransferase [bacterium CPR1]|nr:GNAT family N-acetyltransferase [bacterium CPR1]